MFGQLEFSVDSVVLNAIIASLAFPPLLAAVSAVPALAGKNALRFLAATAVTIGGWLLAIVLFFTEQRDVWQLCVGLMILWVALLFYLEVWALLSRGYTLGLILTLYRARRPLTSADLANLYRGGEGLSWIMKHRLGGLIAAGLVNNDRGIIFLTPLWGRSIAAAYVWCITLLGLRKTG